MKTYGLWLAAVYRKPNGTTLPWEHELFNDAEKSVRVVFKHATGILKGRFPCLFAICQVLAREKSIQLILQHRKAAAILHNLLRDPNNDVPEDCIDYDDVLNIDNPDREEFDPD